MIGISIALSALNLILISIIGLSSPEIVTRHFYSGIELDDETLPGYLRIILLSAVLEPSSKLTKNATDEQTARALAPRQDENCIFDTVIIGIPKLTADGFVGTARYFYTVSGKQIEIPVEIRGRYEAIVPGASNPGGIRIRSVSTTIKENQK